MKKLSSLMLLAFTILFAACSQENLVPNTENTEPGELITISASVQDNVDSRLSFTDEGGSAYKFEWEATDKLTVLNYDQSGKYLGKSTFSTTAEQITSDKSLASFTGTIKDGATHFKIYYQAGDGKNPAIDDSGNTTYDYSNQQQDMSKPTAHFKNYLRIEGEATSVNQMKFGFMLYMKNAMFRFKLTDLPIDEDDEISSMRWISDANTEHEFGGEETKAMTLSFVTNKLTVANKDKNLYLCFDPTAMDLSASKYIKLEFKGKTKTYIACYQSVYGKDYQEGKRYDVTIANNTGVKWVKQAADEIWVTTTDNKSPGVCTIVDYGDPVKVPFTNYWKYKHTAGNITTVPSDLLAAYNASGANPIREKIKTIILPEGVTTINNEAFAGCKNLSSIDMSNAVATINNMAFAGCTNLTSIVMPNTVTTINSQAFMGCSALQSVTLSNKLESIGVSTFAGCTALSTIDIPATVTTLGSGVFSNCVDLTKFTGQFSAGDGRFLIKDKQLMAIAQKFNNTPQTVIDLSGTGITSIANETFIDNTSITTVKLPETGFTTINEYCFSGCTSLTTISSGTETPKANEVHFPTSLTTLKTHAFANCTGLTLVELPANLSSIVTDVFTGCNNVTALKILFVIDPGSLNLALNAADNFTPANVDLYLDPAYKNAVSSAHPDLSTNTWPTRPDKSRVWKSISYAGSGIGGLDDPESGIEGDPTTVANTEILFTSATTPGSDAIAGHTITRVGETEYYRLTKNGGGEITITPQGWLAVKPVKVFLPSSVSEIEFESFKDCTTLTHISMPNVQILDGSAFYGCTGLTHIDLPNSLIMIMGCSLENTSLESIVIPANVKQIWYPALYISTLRSVEFLAPSPMANLDLAVFNSEYTTQCTLKLHASWFTDSTYPATEGKNQEWNGCTWGEIIKLP